jgi:aerobic C4-dicarboxylate transport protein
VGEKDASQKSVDGCARGDGSVHRIAMQKSSRLYLYVVAAVVLGACCGALKPEWGVALKPVADVFLRAIKMLVGPIIFCTVSHGIGSIGDLRKAGKTGLLALLYFEVLTTFALLIGLAVGHLAHVGRGLAATPAAPSADLEKYTRAAADSGGVGKHLLELVPETFIAPFVKGETLPILFLAVLSGAALSAGRGKPWSDSVTRGLHTVGEFFFGAMNVVMKAAPIGAFAAIGFTVGQFGLGSLRNLLGLVASFYISAALFVLIVLGFVCRVSGTSIVRVVRYIRDEIVLVLGTSSSESALPALMTKLERAGCPTATVRLVVPTGYSFNLDGTCIYLSLAALFAADVTGTTLRWQDELSLLLVLLLTSKGAAAVSGGGFITLAATLQSTGSIPLSGMAPLFGIDRFMSEARAITNLIGNAVATIAIARFLGEVSASTLNERLQSGSHGAREPST